MTTVCFLGGGRDAVPIILRAVEAGFESVIVDMDKGCPAGLLPNTEVAVADIYDAGAVLRRLRSGPAIDAVLCAATDAQWTAALIASQLKLPGHSLATSLRAMNKLHFHRIAEGAGIGTPETTYLPHDADSFLARLRELRDGWWVIKPAIGRGSRGVSRVHVDASDPGHIEQLITAVQRARLEGEGDALIQPWIDGLQLSTESVVSGGRVLWTAFAERNYARLDELAPYVVEDGSTTPAELPEDPGSGTWEDACRDILQRTVTVLQVRDGTVKGDLVWDGTKCWVIEVAARLSGGGFCTEIIPRVWGVDIAWLAIRAALGDRLTANDVKPYFRGYVCQRYRFPVRATCHRDRGDFVLGIGKTRIEAEDAAVRMI